MKYLDYDERDLLINNSEDQLADYVNDFCFKHIEQVVSFSDEEKRGLSNEILDMESKFIAFLKSNVTNPNINWRVPTAYSFSLGSIWMAIEMNEVDEIKINIEFAFSKIKKNRLADEFMEKMNKLRVFTCEDDSDLVASELISRLSEIDDN